MLSLSFSIPPCDDSGTGDLDGCCTPDVCPTIIKSSYTRASGNVQYLNELGLRPITPIPGLSNFGTIVRPESIYIYDPQQEIGQAFINIIDGYDVPISDGTKPVFFPTDSTYDGGTSPRQAPYTIDLRLYYNPNSWGRSTSIGGAPRFIQFKNCIVTKVPTRTIEQNDGSNLTINDGALPLAGGLGYEDDGSTIIHGFGSDGITPISNQATLDNFLHKAPRFSVSGNIQPIPDDGYVFSQVEYTFRPNIETLLNKQLVTLGCEPSLALNKSFINSAFAGDAAIKTQQLGNLINSSGTGNGSSGTSSGFPDPNAALVCLQTALAGLRSNLTPAGVAQFQATALICLGKLKGDANDSLNQLVSIGYDACSSDFSLNPKKQFTSKTIKVTVNLKERNGISLTPGMPQEITDSIAKKIKAHNSFGTVGPFTYDGYQSFVADLSSNLPGKGNLMISFENNIFCTNTIPTDNNIDPTHTLQLLDYQFIYTPVSGSVPTGEGDSEGVPFRDAGDISRESS
jgi:hypothetical protein